MKIKTTLRKIATDISFGWVACALGEGMHNISTSQLVEGGEVEKFLVEHDLFDRAHIFMATHSMGGRKWVPVEGRKPPFYPEEDVAPGGGWHILSDGDANFIHLSSASSGSSLTAEKVGESWQLTLEVPVLDDGTPYKGCYWKSFHAALDLAE